MFDHKITELKYHMNGLMPKAICDSLINFFETKKYLSETEQSYKFKEKQNVKDNFKCINLSHFVQFDASFKKPFDIIRTYLSIVLQNYEMHLNKNICPTFENKFFLTTTHNIRILKYEEGQYIKDHSDFSVINRASCTINLNEGYEGGEFRFFDGRVKCSFKTGDAMIFPAEPIWIHGTDPVTKGTRYCINCFLGPQ